MGIRLGETTRFGEIFMPVTSARPRLLKFAIGAVIIAVIMLSVAMCGPSNDSSNNSSTAKPTVSVIPPKSPPSAAPPPAPPPPPEAKDYVEGLVESVSGGTIALRTRTGSATVDFSPSTRGRRADPGPFDRRHPGQLHQCACYSAERASPCRDHCAIRDYHPGHRREMPAAGRFLRNGHLGFGQHHRRQRSGSHADECDGGRLDHLQQADTFELRRDHER